MLAGERFVAEFSLGEVPAIGLAEVMERDLGILVLMVDADDGISGAACRLPELDAVLIARREVVGRRHFDLAHELFHILTWDAMPPEHSEEAMETGGKPRGAARQQFRGGGAHAGRCAGAVRRLVEPGRRGVDRAAERRGGRASCDVLGAAMSVHGVRSRAATTSKPWRTAWLKRRRGSSGGDRSSGSMPGSCARR